MGLFHHDRNLEQLIAPITLIRGGSSRGFYFEGRDVPPPGGDLEEFLLAVRGSPDPMGMDGLGGDTILQSRRPSCRPPRGRTGMWTTRSCRSSRTSRRR